jgi:hypothetical protein
VCVCGSFRWQLTEGETIVSDHDLFPLAGIISIVVYQLKDIDGIGFKRLIYTWVQAKHCVICRIAPRATADQKQNVIDNSMPHIVMNGQDMGD